MDPAKLTCQFWMDSLGCVAQPQQRQVLNCLRQHAPSWLAQMPSVIPPAERSALAISSAGGDARANAARNG